MKRMLRRIVPLSMVGVLVSLAAPTPAQAHTDVCAGAFTLSISNGLGAPLVTGTTTTFSLQMTTGACASGSLFSASGTLTGACVVAFGNGISNTGHPFAFQLAGTTTFTGGVTGALTLVSDPGSGGSCLSNSASGFILTGTVALTH